MGGGLRGGQPEKLQYTEENSKAGHKLGSPTIKNTAPVKYSVKIAVRGDQLYGGCEPSAALLSVSAAARRFEEGGQLVF